MMYCTHLKSLVGRNARNIISAHLLIVLTWLRLPEANASAASSTP